MSYIRFYSNYVFDKENEAPEAIFIDTYRKRRIIIDELTKSDVLEVAAKSFEDMKSYELINTARILLKKGVAYLADGDVLPEAVFDSAEDRAFEQRMLGWWKKTSAEKKDMSGSLTKICLTA